MIIRLVCVNSRGWRRTGPQGQTSTTRLSFFWLRLGDRRSCRLQRLECCHRVSSRLAKNPLRLCRFGRIDGYIQPKIATARSAAVPHHFTQISVIGTSTLFGRSVFLPLYSITDPVVPLANATKR